ncbi:MAG: M28 family peptidase [Myxococcales bacterium]|nr:M28 family peptidase [Myxococcota bacterium]MDW8281911.1 M28 family peptidase [Myxococcales bacterium]
MSLLTGLLLTGSAALAGPPPALLHPKEVRLADLRQITFGGENAEAYFSPDGTRLILQATTAQDRCDQIYTIELAPILAGARAELRRVSDGRGRTTCSFFFPDGQRVLFSSTRHVGDSCPPAPDRSRGYVWPLYHYQLYTARPDGTDLQRLTRSKGYDAEATVCHDGTVVFTSDRDGDLELYRMRTDGSGLVRLTNAPGYDGGAFFSEDCQRIVWRADRPRNDAEAAEMQALLRDRLVRPSRMELWVANADGSGAHPVTSLGGASFAPYFIPQRLAPGPRRRILFSSNHHDPRRREFDLWAINEDGTDLERVTYTEEFDGFPMFAPQGRHLVFASNRGARVRGETNIFLATWQDRTGERVETPADRAARRVAWLADPARQGRGVGSRGLAAAAEEIARWMREAGLVPAGSQGFFQPVEIQVGVRDGGSWFRLRTGEGTPVRLRAAPASMSDNGRFAGEVRFAGYGITAPEAGWDDLTGLDVRDRVAVVLRGVPAGRFSAAAARSYSDLRYKAWNLREHGARAVAFVDLERDGVPELTLDGPEGGAGLPVLFVERGTIVQLLPEPQREGGMAALRAAADRGEAAGIALLGELSGQVTLRRQVRQERNVIGLLRASGATAGAVVIGAHYDHLGLGGRGSFVPDQRVVHPGADDNASGTVALLEVAHRLREAPPPLDVYFVAFTGEEVGLVGSSRFVRDLPRGLVRQRLRAMINLDMVGRLASQEGTTLPALAVGGTDSAKEWTDLVQPVCRGLGLVCHTGGDGYGPSDMTPFYAAGVPVLFFFTGAHADYHRPSDTADRINALGVVQVGQAVAGTVQALAAHLSTGGVLTFQRASRPPPRPGDGRGYGAYLGTIPDFSAMQGRKGGVRLSGTRPGSPAEQAGARPGDVLVGLAGKVIDTLEDMAFVLRSLKPGEQVEMILVREGKRLTVPVTLGQRPGEAAR